LGTLRTWDRGSGAPRVGVSILLFTIILRASPSPEETCLKKQSHADLLPFSEAEPAPDVVMMPMQYHIEKRLSRGLGLKLPTPEESARCCIFVSILLSFGLLPACLFAAS
jgi:hypothetical protein